MGVDYSAYTFYGMKIAQQFDLDESEYESYGESKVVYPEGFGYLTLGSWMGGTEPSVWLTYGKVYGGNIRRHSDDEDILSGVRIGEDIDPEWARFAFAEVCEKNGWTYSEPGWYVGMSIS